QPGLHRKPCQPGLHKVLQEEATLLPGAAALVHAAAGAGARVTLLAHVAGDVGAATVQGVLEAGGVVGPLRRQVAPSSAGLVSRASLVGLIRLTTWLYRDLVA